MSDDSAGDAPKLPKLVIPEIPEHMRPILNAVKNYQAQQPSRQIASLQIPKYAAPWLEATRSIAESLKPMALWVNEHREEFARLGTIVQKANETFSASLLPMVKQLQDGFANLAPVIDAALKGYKARLETYPNLSQHCELLAKHGWFLSLFFGLSEFDEIASVAGQDIELLEQKLAQAYRSSIEEHTTSILREYPEREFAIRPAVAAHMRGEYALSVPMFFSQADGICAATVGKHIFSGRPGGAGHISSLAMEEISRLNLESEEHGDKLFSLLEIALWNPLAEPQPIAYNEMRREEAEYSGLNRHCVLHGESLDYATEINSLKAFSLLSYVASLLAGKKDGAVAEVISTNGA